jgi:uncharacterized protein (DUF849 family)
MKRPADPVVLCVAPNGARRGKADNPAIPLSAEEIAREALNCAQAGATVLHLHVRDASGNHSLDPGRYREAMAAVAAAVGDRMLIQITSEGAGRYEPAEQAASILEVRPRLASVAVREMLLAPDVAQRFYAAATEAGIALQHILYSADDMTQLLALVRAGTIGEGAHALLVLGRYAADMTSDPRDLPELLRAWPAEWPWSACAFGATEPQCLAAAIGLGGHVRVGFENNLAGWQGGLATDNAQNVGNIAELARRAGRGIADVGQAGRAYGLVAGAELERG